jgi:hypothetical protein
MEEKPKLLLWEQEVVGSNPATPTRDNQRLFGIYILEALIFCL